MKKPLHWSELFPVTWWLIAVTSFISIVVLISQYFYPDIWIYVALKPSDILRGKYLWTLFTHMFVHGGLLHLMVNMFALFSLGGLCERVIGRKRFLWLYLSSGLIAGVLSVILSGFYGSGEWGMRIFGSSDIFMVGASGALFSVAGLFVILLPRIKFSIIFLPFFSFPAYILVPLLLAIMWIATIFANLPIGNVAHFGGFLVGLVYGFYLRTKYKKKVEMLDKYFSKF